MDQVRVEGTPWPGPLRLAEAIGPAIGAQACVLTVDGERFAWGHDDGTWWVGEVEYSGEAQGSLALSPESAGPAHGLAEVLAPLVAVLRLARETDRQWREGDAAERELADSRWRAAAEMDQERRGLERNLHDGVQHHLVALRMSLALLEHTIATSAADATRQRLNDLEERLDTAERLMTSTAAGILPITLVTDGLVAALRAELAEHDNIVLDISELRRYPEVVESAVYFVCLEAVNNAHKHAPDATITVVLRDEAGGVRFEVHDDGPGFDHVPADSGLHHLAARMAAVGGAVEIISTPGRGTTVRGSAPA